MSFDDFINIYGQKELNIAPVKYKDGKLMVFIDGNKTNENGDTVFFYFIITGNFKIHFLKYEDGWEYDDLITTFSISKIDAQNNIYAIKEYLGGYIEFSVYESLIEELPYGDFQKRWNKLNKASKL